MSRLLRGSLPLLSVLLLALPLAAQESLPDLVTAEMPDLLSTYTRLHSHPELSYQEKQTAAYLAGELRRLGFEVTENVGDYGVPGRTSYGLVAVLRNGEGPTVMVRTDLDALPVVEQTGLPYASQVRVESGGNQVGVMHACGHDIHMTSFLGTARLLAQLRDRWGGTLVLIGQPAEERGAGARALLAGGLYERFPRPDFALALHTSANLPAGTIGYRAGYALANVDSVDITIRGVGGHGAYPHTTKDPIVIAARLILALQTIVSREINPLEPAVITVGSIHAGTKHNIIPDEAHLQLTVRSYTPEVRRQLLSSIERMAREAAEVAGVPPERAPIVEVNIDEYTPSTYNDPELVRRAVAAMRAVLGEENVIETDPVMGGEDFSRYALDGEIPIFMFWVGGVDPERYREAKEKGLTLPSLHSPLFAPVPEPTLRTAVQAMTAAVLELMNNR
ncbi:MAG: amidohydrolase [Candidatus Acidoferrales bacterium]